MISKNIKKDFPIFKNNPRLIYLDSAATSQKPKEVIDSLKNFYEKENANINRGLYSLSEKSTKRYDDAKKTIAEFINARHDEIIFTRGATESLNFLSYVIPSIIPKSKNEIVLTEMEHHSNIIPWQQLAKRGKFKLKFIPITENYELDYKKAEKLISNKTALISFSHISNVFGTINDAERLIRLAQKSGAITIIDAAQSAAHIKLNVKKLDCDFLAFSGHKVFGPFGIGVLYGKKQLLEKLPPFQFGGGAIDSVSYEDSIFAESPRRFEAGTPNIAGAIAFSEAIKYITKIGINNIKKIENELTDYAVKKMKEIPGIKLYNPGVSKSSSIISFNIGEIHPHDTSSILSGGNVCIRAGHHCCMPLMKKLGIMGKCRASGVCRASFSFYNTKEDIDKMIKRLKKVVEVFKENVS